MKLPRFTLRELFLLVVIAAMGCGWWVERQNTQAAIEVERLQAKTWRDNAVGLQFFIEREHGRTVKWDEGTPTPFVSSVITPTETGMEIYRIPRETDEVLSGMPPVTAP